MNDETKSGMNREAVAVFHTEENLEAAIDDLLTHGFDRAQISLMAPASVVDEKLGHRFDSVADLEDDPSTPRVAYVSRDAIGDAEGAVIGGLVYVGAVVATGAVVASGGALLPVIAAAAAGGTGGAVLGGVLAKIIGETYGKYVCDQLERGGMLLWVRTFEEEQEKKAVDILKRHTGADVHVHGLPESDRQSETHAGYEIIWYDTSTYWIGSRPFGALEEAKAFAERLRGKA